MSSNGSDPVSAWTRFWLDSAAQAMQAWTPAAGSTQSPELIRKCRADLMQAWSDWCEKWLRSPAFLDAQKQLLDGNLAVRKQFRAVMRRMQRELQLAGREDIDALEAAIRRSERRVLDQMEETSAQLKCAGSQDRPPRPPRQAFRRRRRAHRRGRQRRAAEAPFHRKGLNGEGLDGEGLN